MSSIAANRKPRISAHTIMVSRLPELINQTENSIIRPANAHSNSMKPMLSGSLRFLRIGVNRFAIT